MLKLITSMVEPDSWAPEGESGAIGIYDGLLVVRNTSSAQRQVADLLNILRAAKASRQARGTAAVTAER
ncbi:MAG TPA: hypothetical protein PKG54_06950 [Phycisphaerae bacterium]|nr:hypothetical protein [Phycisphaerae bacterium]HOB74246.1 hypothetical protein [Phycisphaerae bacterium]HOJ53162.1 hypothetical protein [Phycisphaerae bacterium]HOL24899.1 hypothetical protein [Phycisphaerae bacterium]HPP19435.1 hypothetical protein [Phycisphaerae bacterium]